MNKIEKTIANANPIEQLQQLNKMAHKAESFLKGTNILEIRKKKPESENPTKEELVEQGKKNLWEIFDVICNEYPTETVELLGLMCFMENEEAMQHSIFEFIEPLGEILANNGIVNFFMQFAN